MTETLTWGALVLSGSAVIAIVKFWIDIGKAFQRIDDGAQARGLIDAKMELTRHELNDFKIEVARDYATVRSIADTETWLRDALAQINTRLDNLLMIARNGQHK